MEIIEVISKALRREQEEEYTKAAFIGYQNYLCQPKGKNARPMGFEKWLKMLGLEKKVPQKPPTKEELERARKNAERIMANDTGRFERMKQRRMRKRRR